MSLFSSHSTISSRYICWHCSIAQKAFSSAAARHSIPPESPKFIEVPRPAQEYKRIERRVKGVLPVPKNIFPKGSDAKASPLYLDAVTKEPLPRRRAESPDSERVAWNLRMSEARRKNLREGILELHHRRDRDQHEGRKRTFVRNRRQQALRTEAEREDERLTRPSVSEVLRDVFKRDHEHHRNDDIEERRARYQQHEALKSDARKDAIHTLYMHARDFIVTEEQLNKAVEEAFTTPEGAPKDQSIWEGDVPMTTADMLNGDGRKDNVGAERMKRLAEELTGGKI